MKLISIPDHSDYIDTLDISKAEKWDLHCLRKGFGKQPLTLGMFVPCDEEGNVLIEPMVVCADGAECSCKIGNEHCPAPPEHQSEKYRQYQAAKDRVLFEGCSLDLQQLIWDDGSSLGKLIGVYPNVQGEFNPMRLPTVEHLLNEEIHLELTPTALKQIGL